MTINRLAQPASGGTGPKQCPADMPRGDGADEKAARQRFWIERGNANLVAAGKTHLHWRCDGAHYWIEEREETMRSLRYEQMRRLEGGD